MNSSEIYPSINEIIPELLEARIPAGLAHDIKQRYEQLGDKYVTKDKHIDGRYINACMYKSSAQDALEEVIDAAFNTLVWMFKLGGDNSEQGFRMGLMATDILLGLIELYSLLRIAREKEEVGESLYL